MHCHRNPNPIHFWGDYQDAELIGDKSLPGLREAMQL